MGPIGGIQQKMVGARRAGATIFLTPAENCAEAVRAVPNGLRLVKVETLRGALDALEALTSGDGGRGPGAGLLLGLRRGLTRRGVTGSMRARAPCERGSTAARDVPLTDIRLTDIRNGARSGTTAADESLGSVNDAPSLYVAIDGPML